MKYYTAKKEAAAKAFVADDMLLTTDMPTAAGSRMLSGYMSLIEAEAITRMKAAGYDLAGKAKVGEFAIDLIGESAYDVEGDTSAAAEIVAASEAEVALCLDVNGYPRRSAAKTGLVCLKPTYGRVSRYGTVPVACSGECVSFIAKTVDAAMSAYNASAGYDAKDGTSVPDSMIKSPSAKNKVAVLSDLSEGLAEIDAICSKLTAAGVTVDKIENSRVASARAAWNILMCAELCNNVSRYDGVKYGYRAGSFGSIDELYTNSRTEAFGDLLKSAIIYGSETLSTDNYMKVYDKALRVRRVISEAFAAIFENYDAVLIPTCSSANYSDAEKDAAFTENIYTAPASVTGLPVLVVDGVQLIGAHFSEELLASLGCLCEKEGK